LAAAARHIGAVTTIERVPAENYGEHLRVHAFGDNRNKGKTILLLGHTDTVHPFGSLQQRPWRVEGDRAYGPGVFDMKANCALAIEAIRCCTALNLTPKSPVVLLLTCDEETGSMSGRGLVEAEARRARSVLVLEPPAGGGRVKTGRKGTGMFTLVARGRAAHAGLEPEKGVSAILEMARQIERLHALNDYHSGTTVNVGVIHGGTASNVVAAEAVAEIDLRFAREEVPKQILGLRPFDDRIQPPFAVASTGHPWSGVKRCWRFMSRHGISQRRWSMTWERHRWVGHRMGILRRPSAHRCWMVWV
jgi:glutamate carboxypeptidase